MIYQVRYVVEKWLSISQLVVNSMVSACISPFIGIRLQIHNFGKLNLKSALNGKIWNCFQYIIWTGTLVIMVKHFWSVTDFGGQSIRVMQIVTIYLFKYIHCAAKTDLFHRFDSDIRLKRCISRFLQYITICSMVFKISWRLNASHQGLYIIKSIENSYLHCICSFEVIL